MVAASVEDEMRTEGYVEVGAGRVWYESVGAGPQTILLLHGGPGASSDYLVPLMELAEDGYRVVRYDQLGSRRSDKPDDLTLWQVPRFIDEVETVRSALGLGQVHLLGQSWGAVLALAFALEHQDRLRSLILYSGAASIPQCVDGMNALKDALPAGIKATLARHEASGETDHPDYLEAIDVLYRQHLCRVAPYPPLLDESMSNMALPVYGSMWGPNEFTCTGTLCDWECVDRLGEIRVPTLITCGRYDEVIPACSETMHRGIADSELVVFEESSHLAHFEEPDRYFAVLRGFLARIDAAPK